MRKHKSVVAILLAVMMIFTFMPTMAFAYETGSNPVIDWGDNFQTATSKNATTGAVTNYDVTYAVTPVTGMITATASSTVNGVKKDVGSAAFFDLTGATLYRNTANPVSGNYDYSIYTRLFNGNLYVKLAKPSYIKEAEWAAATVGVQSQLGTSESDTGAWNHTWYTIKAKGKADETATKGETKNIAVEVTANHRTAKGTEECPFLIGPDPAASVTITDGSDVATAEGWYLDSVVASKRINVGSGSSVEVFSYDGKEHTILYKADANDQVVSYEKLNSRNVWEATGAITLKDAGTYGRYRAVCKDASGNVYYSNVQNLKQQFTVASAGLAPTFGFKPMAGSKEKYNYELTAEQAADPAKFVELTAKSFVDVDEETLMNYFNDYYEVKVTKVASNENLQTWTIAPKYKFDAAATSDDGKALAELNKKYATLLKNYGLVSGTESEPTYGHFNATGTANVKVDTSAEINTKDDDITFTGVTTKSYKAKKKTKKLAKNKSFQVAATAASGNAVTFTATSSNGKVSIDATGKVTVKKGLKKGAKVKLVVKAQTAAGNGYKAVSAEKTYTIKVK